MSSSREKLAGYLSEERIEEFRAIYQRQNGREISKEGAYERALHLIGFMGWLNKPLGKAEFDAMRSMPEEGQAGQDTPGCYSNDYPYQNPGRQGGSHD
jgi:hypothetical protein